MSYSPGNKERNTFQKTRGFTGLSMGVLYCALALFFGLYKSDATIDFVGGNKTLMIALLGLMFAYGIFRIYRGYRLIKGME